MKISPSLINILSDCSYKWKKIQIDRVRTPISLDALVGIYTHKSIENYLLGKSESLEDEFMSSCELNEISENPTTCWDIVEKNLSLFREWKEKENLEFVGIEEKFESEYRNIIISGKYDLLTNNGILIDIKTTKRKIGNIRPYLTQMGVYGMAIENLYGFFPELQILNIVNGRRIEGMEIDTKEARKVAEINLEKVATFLDIKEKIGDVVFTKNPNSYLCNSKYCSFYEECFKGE